MEIEIENPSLRGALPLGDEAIPDLIPAGDCAAAQTSKGGSLAMMGSRLLPADHNPRLRARAPDCDPA
ncbi:MAG: hypothetical protein P8129_01390 [Anaerolineae bacterium]